MPAFVKSTAPARARETIILIPARLASTRLPDHPRLALDSLRVIPAKLLAAGFKFRYPQLREALESVV